MNKQRKAIAMIELIFALVIMGIVMMSAPMLISQSQKSTQVVLQQEAIAAGVSDLNMILSRHWDEADTNTTVGAPVLLVNNGSSLLAPISSTERRRIGTPTTSNRNFLDNLGTEQNATAPNRFGPLVASTLENDDSNNSYDDIDDFATINVNDTGTLLIADVALRGDLVDTAANTGSKGMVFNTQILYTVDANTTFDSSTITFNPFNSSPTGTTNVKMIKITVTTDSNIDELEKKIVLKAFSSNIGEYKLEARSF